MANDSEMRDADAVEEERRQYINGAVTEEELDEKYPSRPHNHSRTFPFHELFLNLFNPLNDNKKNPTGPPASRKKQGSHGGTSLSAHEVRRNVIERFISQWRKEVGNDIYPAFRLIVPEKDRDRAMYGLKEKAIAKILIRVLKINKDSEDGYNLLNWKLPGQKAGSTSAGDFAARCYDVISKRPMRTTVGKMTIGEVNELLDKLSVASKEDEQRPIFEQFYQSMDSDEMMWLIRIILRQMKVGASERTFFDIWHPDAENLFNISSSLRRVCWELYDPSIRLNSEDTSISLMQCFQPQLAAFQMAKLDNVIAGMRAQEKDDAFWIEEKMDGERMQLHMIEDDAFKGGKRFAFWSRKAKDYTYLYGNGFHDDSSALTRHIKDAFTDSVRSIILDGEMITWDMEQDAVVPFGTLKTAALSEQKNPFGTGQRPLFRVFDCLLLNGQPITNYTLRDRRRALEASIHTVDRRLELQPYTEARTKDEIEARLREVVADASEGLVIKNPRSMYRLNERNADWIKVKPEYMTEFGEDLDCVIIGGYYGSGHRGGTLSSFLCGLRANDSEVQRGASPKKFYSFFKVGGGMAAADYANIRHQTEGKWHKWNPARPPPDIVLGGGTAKQYERPDEWIKPEDSVVISVKAASVAPSDMFATELTLRFPRFKKMRSDKDWRTALSVQDWVDLKSNAEHEHKEKQMEIDQSRKKRRIGTRQKPITVLGDDEEVSTQYGAPQSKLFEGMSFHIITEAITPRKMTKAELEGLIKAHGGETLLKEDNADICVAEAGRKPLKVQSIIKKGEKSLVRPAWIFDCIAQAEADKDCPRFLIPFEPNHMRHIADGDYDVTATAVDEFQDSYARDVSISELKEIFATMPKDKKSEVTGSKPADMVEQFTEHDIDLRDVPGWMFHRVNIHLALSTSQVNGKDAVDMPTAADIDLTLAGNHVRFASGTVCSDLTDKSITHVIVGEDRSCVANIRRAISDRKKIPRIVHWSWITESWKEKTLLDEDKFGI